ncbi:MAG: hypothetical protein ABI895_13320 [Deltaproteobacteria bacterium]
MTDVRTYDIKAFLGAHIDTVRYVRAHKDLATYYTGLYQALCRAFGFDLTQLPSPLSIVFKSAVRGHLDTRSPLAGFMEGPPIIGELEQRHSQRIGEAVLALREAHIALLLDILEHAHGPLCAKVVDSTKLRELGFDDATFPDPDDYW